MSENGCRLYMLLKSFYRRTWCMGCWGAILGLVPCTSIIVGMSCWRTILSILLCANNNVRLFRSKSNKKHKRNKGTDHWGSVINWRYVAEIKEISEVKLEKRGWSWAQELACWHNTCTCMWAIRTIFIPIIQLCGQYKLL